MRNTNYLMILAAPLALAACNSQAESDAAAEASAGVSVADDNAAEADGGQMASTTGTVTAIDAGAGTITIEHGPVPEVNWPAMTMAFDADKAMLDKVAPGDQVAFEFRKEDSGSTVTSIAKQ